jgi:hypothetical protein
MLKLERLNGNRTGQRKSPAPPKCGGEEAEELAE